MKGLRDFDMETAYEAMRKSATLPGKENLYGDACGCYGCACCLGGCDYGKDKLVIEKKENGSSEGYIQKIS